MTHRERLIAVIEGRKPDKLPWIPRLELWYKAHSTQGTLPERYKGHSLREIQRILGVGSPARDGQIFETILDGVDVREERKGDEVRKTYFTPAGIVTEASRRNPRSEALGLPFEEGQVEHMIKTADDYRVVEYIVEHTTYLPRYEDYLAYEREIGEDGIPMIFTAHDPMFRILHYYIGYNQAYYELADHRKEVERLYDLLWSKLRELQDILINSPSRIILHGAHFDSLMTPPPIFDKYMKPYFQDFASRLHNVGKPLAIHADANSKLLLRLFLESGIDMVECFCTAPMVPVTMEEALDAWGDRMIIWGGVPSIMLCPSSSTYEEFISYMRDLFRILKEKGGRVILGVADNVMPEADIARVEKISEMVEEFQ